jgi:hypothetical protein
VVYGAREKLKYLGSRAQSVGAEVGGQERGGQG